MDFSEDDQWFQAVAMSLREATHQIPGKPLAAGDPPSAAPPDFDEEPLSKEKLGKKNASSSAAQSWWGSDKQISRLFNLLSMERYLVLNYYADVNAH